MFTKHSINYQHFEMRRKTVRDNYRLESLIREGDLPQAPPRTQTHRVTARVAPESQRPSLLNNMARIRVTATPIMQSGNHKIQTTITKDKEYRNEISDPISFKDLFRQNFGLNQPERLKNRFKHLLYGKEYC